MGLAPKMSPNQPRGQILRRFPEPSAKRPPWLKSRVLSLRHVLGSCAGRPTMICFTRGGLEAPQHGTHCPQAPWPEEHQPPPYGFMALLILAATSAVREGRSAPRSGDVAPLAGTHGARGRRGPGGPRAGGGGSCGPHFIIYNTALQCSVHLTKKPQTSKHTAHQSK